MIRIGHGYDIHRTIKGRPLVLGGVTFAADFGLDGTDGLLKFPAFEGWGNHDGPPEPTNMPRNLS